ncbi:unnamed protein product (macronuclear) [Paramecium tetraurelia]|uniref:TNFR-Cys domain-containing protein n=1 Tax=Paramecium tetraurelia TaxID=5888 RepID=A0BVL9_PARTE|nr:uncharacterized protein GSPATT00005832001 [Paramecium tetraurelia]CAK62586.1 unnamed protein product [Paramecium tetraurelia]|eukprot:XP_001429984.1 hypothetical protein (macronuclear) [Paramecium tetraurelia strain d4-2]
MHMNLKGPLNPNQEFLTVIILSQLIGCALSQTSIYSNFFGDFSYSNDWFIYGSYTGPVSYCGSTKIFGGSPQFTRYTHIIKTFNLPPHYQIMVAFKFWHLDNWGGEYLKVYVDNVEAHSQSYSSEYTQPSICGTSGSSYGDGISSVSRIMIHTSYTAQIIINGFENYWGISEFELLVYKCATGCQICDSSKCYVQNLYMRKLDPINFDSNYGWLYNDQNMNTYAVCLDQNYLKSPSSDLTKIIRLTSHNNISLRLKIMTFNSDPHSVQIYIDTVLVQTSNLSEQVFTYSDLCDVMTLSQIQILEYQHSRSTIQIQVISTWSGKYNSALQQTLGVSDFELFVHPYPTHALICNDQNNIAFDGCFSNTYDCVVGCRNCVKGDCIKCKVGWEYQISQRKCIPICGDLIITYLEECDDGNMIPYDGCYQCKFSCSKFCGNCKFGKCLECLQSFRLIEHKCVYVYNYYDDPELRQKAEFNNQIINFMERGFYQHALLYDYQIGLQQVKQLDCNQQSYGIFGYYYHQCSIDRIFNCKEQLFDICLECQPYFYLKLKNKECHPICGDGVILQSEICDDQNNFQFDDCYKCQSSCQLECRQCKQNQCYDCIDGWSLINNYCYQICGDGMQAFNSQEQCDDGNYENNDGCYECKYECDQNCYFCSQSNICMLCNQHFQLIDNTYCAPICGDGIIVQGLEECEDLNDVEFDGCYQCTYQCEINCSKCIEGICQECIDGFELTLQGCQRIINYEDESEIEEEIVKIQLHCGDGWLSNDEECDDWNILNNDGCSSNCNIETGWVCNEQEPSKCFSMTIFLLSYLNRTYQHQYVQLSFSNLVKLKDNSQNFTNSLTCLINNLDLNEYNITVYPVIDFNDAEFVPAVFNIKITIFQPIQAQPNLTVAFNTSIIDVNNMLMKQSQQILLLQTPQILDSSQLQAANSFQELGNKIMLGLGIISILMLLFGRIDLSLEILDTLLFQTYLKFVNVNYPQNLQIYFQSSDFVSINPILVNFKIQGVLDSAIGANYIQSYGKLSEYQVNADLFVNIKGQILQLSFVLLLLMFARVFQKFFLNYCFTSRYFYCIRRSKSRFIEFIAIKYYQMINGLLGLKNMLSMGRFRQIFYANSWDLLFKVILFLKSNNQSGYRTVFSYFFSVGCLSLVIFFLSSHFKKQNGKINLTIVRNEQHQGVILFKKLSFILILIVLQNAGAFQCLMITFLTFSYIGLIFAIKLIKQKFDLFIVVLMEAPVMFFTSTSILYCSDFQQLLSLNQQVLLGFGQIGILLISLFGPVIRFNYIIYKQIKAYLAKREQNEITRLVTQTNLFAVVDI